MGDNTPARVASVGDLENFHSDNQWSRIHLAIQPAATVYTARVNQTFESYDGLFEIEYDGGSGELSEVVPNLLLLIGSSAGAHDHGVCRIRKAPSAAKFYIGLASGVFPEDDDYLTVIDFMPLCARYPTASGENIRMDVDVDYSADADAPIPALGPLVAVVRLTGETVDFTPVDPSDLSWSPIGAALTDYLFDAPGASATADMDTTQPTFTYDTAGWYRWSCTITDENAVSSTGYRWLVVEPDSPDFSLQSCAGSVQEGGWMFSVKVSSGGGLDTVRDRALCVLWTEDYYDNLPVGIGPIEGYENILAVGWIEAQSISHNQMNETVDFTVRGPAHWLKQLQTYPFYVSHTSTTAASWDEIENLTVDKGLARLFHWLSNASQILDCIPTGNANIAESLIAGESNLFGQMDALAQMVFSKTLVNRFGQLFVNTNPQYLTSTEKNSVPLVQEVTSVDWRDELTLERVTEPKVSQMELEALESYDGANPITVWSRAPGNIPLEYGEPDTRQNFIVADQTECNRVAGVALAVENNEYPSIPINFAANQRLVDITPAQFFTLTVAEADTARGIAFSDKRMIPRSVRLNVSGMKIRMDVDFEAEVTSTDGINYYPPQPTNVNVQDSDFDFEPFDMGGIGSFPNLDTTFPSVIPSIPSTSTDCKTSTDLVNAPTNLTTLTFDKLQLKGSDVDRVAYAYCPCYVRKGAASAPTDIWLVGNFMNSKDAVHLYGVKNGVRVVTATMNLGTMGGRCTFAPANAVLVDGFELEIDELSNFDIVPGVIDSGTVQADNGSGVAVEGMTIDEYYAIQGAGGPWQPGPGFSNTEYNFQIDGTGAIGWGGNSSTFLLDLPTIGLFAEAVDEYYGRVYFKAEAETVQFRVNDSVFTDNTGSLGFELYAATVDEEPLANIGSATLRNICAV